MSHHPAPTTADIIDSIHSALQRAGTLIPIQLAYDVLARDSHDAAELVVTRADRPDVAFLITVQHADMPLRPIVEQRADVEAPAPEEEFETVYIDRVSGPPATVRRPLRNRDTANGGA